MSEKCLDCHHYEGNYQNGRCTVDPPRMVGEIFTPGKDQSEHWGPSELRESVWPRVTSTDRCGRFKGYEPPNYVGVGQVQAAKRWFRSVFGTGLDEIREGAKEYFKREDAKIDGSGNVWVSKSADGKMPSKWLSHEELVMFAKWLELES